MLALSQYSLVVATLLIGVALLASAAAFVAGARRPASG